MKTKLKVISIFLAFFGMYFNLSAQEKPTFEQISIEEQLSEQNSLGAYQFKGQGATLWKKTLKKCMQSKLISKKNVEYLGVSNRISIGDIADAGLNSTLRQFQNLELSAAELKKVIIEGSNSTCNQTISKKVDLNTLIDAGINSGNSSFDAELSTIIKGEKKIVFTVDSWQMNELIINDLLDILKGKDKYSGYSSDLKNSNNRVMNREILIKGFTAKITTDRELTIALKETLENGIEAKLNNLNGNIKLQLVGNKELVISTVDEFIVFGKFSQIKN